MHVSVAGTETDHLAKLISEKAEELDAACVIMASHGKSGFQVNNCCNPCMRSSTAAHTAHTDNMHESTTTETSSK